AVNGIEVGGINLVSNAIGDNDDDWKVWSDTSSSIVSHDSTKWIQVRNTASVTSATAIHTPTFAIKGGKTYVVSFTIKSHYNLGYDLNYLYLRDKQTSTIKSLPNVDMRSEEHTSELQS